MLRALLIASSLALAGTPCIAQQVRVISGGIQHVYGPGGQILDDAGLQARNQRAWEHMQAEKQLAIERRQVEIENQRLKLQEAAVASGMTEVAQNWYSADGGWFIGPTRGISPRIGHHLRRIGISPRIGIPRKR
jgi:hypothetical protein